MQILVTLSIGTIHLPAIYGNEVSLVSIFPGFPLFSFPPFLCPFFFFSFFLSDIWKGDSMWGISKINILKNIIYYYEKKIHGLSLYSSKFA